MALPPKQIAEWMRPTLTMLGNNLLGVIPVNGFPGDHKRIHAQYEAIFKARLGSMLRDVEIGLDREAGFARALAKSPDQMKAEVYAHMLLEEALQDQENRTAGRGEIKLFGAAEDPPLFSNEFQTEFKAVQAALSAEGIKAEAPFMVMDSVGGGGG
jgi:hypothetical protein